MEQNLEQHRIDMLFDDCNRCIDFAKTQMWDTLKWAVTIYTATIGFFFVVNDRGKDFGVEIYGVVIFPLLIGVSVLFLLKYHSDSLFANQMRLATIMESMGDFVRSIYPDYRCQVICEKPKIGRVYKLINIFSSLAAFMFLFWIAFAQRCAEKIGAP